MKMRAVASMSCGAPSVGNLGGESGGFPCFLPREVEAIRDPAVRKMARRIQRVPVKGGSLKAAIMSSCVKPLHQREKNPVVLLHGFDSSCLEWSYSFPLLEEAGLETWAVDVLGWGFSDLRMRPSCDAISKREHLYQLWKTYIRRPMTLVGPSLGAAVSIDFASIYPDAVSKLVLIAPNVYAKGVGKMRKLPPIVAYAGVSLLKSFPLRLYASTLTFKSMSLQSKIEWTNVSRLHCLQSWWEDATVDFMMSGGCNVISKIKEIKHPTFIISGEDDKLVSSNLAQKLHGEMKNSVLYRVPKCGHVPHVERPNFIARKIVEVVRCDQDVAEKVVLAV